MTQFTREQATHVVLVGLFIWVFMGGCSWRLPKDPPEELQHVLKRALHAKVEEFQSLIEQNLILRERILQEANRPEDLFTWDRGEVEAIAVVEVPEGLLYTLEEKRAEALDHLSPILEPGDTLLEKSLFRLADRNGSGLLGTRRHLARDGGEPAIPITSSQESPP